MNTKLDSFLFSKSRSRCAFRGTLAWHGGGFQVCELDAGDHKGPHPSDHAAPAPTGERASHAD